MGIQLEQIALVIIALLARATISNTVIHQLRPGIIIEMIHIYNK